MGLKKDFIKESVNTILQIHPDLNKDDIERIVIRKFKEKMMDPPLSIDNNVTGEREDINLTELCNWIEKKLPVVSGNATFYMQPDVLESPTSNMLRSLKKERKQIKREMFKYQPEDDEYQRLDLAQMNAKVVMNAEYGASGAPMAAFYTKYSPAATTIMAQSIITTMAAFFEGYVGDNMRFFHINECFDWMNTIRKKKEKVPNWIISPNLEETICRIKSHFFEYDSINSYVIERYLSNCTNDELTYIFYANNFKEFVLRHPKIQKLIRQVLTSLPLHEAAEKEIPSQYRSQFPSVDKYNDWVSKEMFLNPYDVPAVIKEDMESLTKFMNQFCFVEYLTPDSIVKLNNKKRNTILLVDTDSNVINANIFVKFILNEVFPGETFSRKKIYNEMICVNMLANIVDSCVMKLLDLYGRVHNMGEDARKELAMKNEFMFKRFFLTGKKKRYAASIVLREGHIIVPYKVELKGFDFIKAGVTDEVTNRFTRILRDYILFSEDLELYNLMADLKRFEKEIYEDLRNGGVRFLRTQTYKAEEAYKERVNKKTGEVTSGSWFLQVFRAASIWNEIYPHQKIYSLDRVKIAKLIVTGLTDLEGTKKNHPKEYQLIKNKIFGSSNSEIVKAGMKVIAIPGTVKQMPDWIIDLLDYDVIISDIIGSFRSVWETLKIEGLSLKTPHGKANITSSLISV